MPELRTLAAPVRTEIDRIKGSRFIGDAAPAADEAAATAFLEAVRARDPQATHHCFAWRIDEARSRASDDGEPAGTAGEPILRRIDGAGLQQVVLVVTRHYGGTKLGTGGLVRAYGAAADAVLALGVVVVRRATVRLAVEHEYAHEGPIRAVLAAHGAEPESEAYGLRVRLVVPVPVEAEADFARDVRDATGGRGTVGPA